MATQTHLVDGRPVFQGTSTPVWVKVHVDFTVTPAASADVIQLIGVAAGTLVSRVIVNPTTADGESSTIDIGDGSSATRFLSNTDINATTLVSATTYYVYASSDTIDMVCDDAKENAIVDVYFELSEPASFTQS